DRDEARRHCRRLGGRGGGRDSGGGRRHARAGRQAGCGGRGGAAPVGGRRTGGGGGARPPVRVCLGDRARPALRKLQVDRQLPQRLRVGGLLLEERLDDLARERGGHVVGQVLDEGGGGWLRL